jgi:Domain of unknown function (DUF3854)
MVTRQRIIANCESMIAPRESVAASHLQIGQSDNRQSLTTRSFRNVRRTHPCPICRRPDWCSISADGVIALCRRVAVGAAAVKRDRNGLEYYVHYPNGRPPTAQLPTAQFSPQPEARRADADTLNSVYSALLALLSVDSRHIAELYRRGFDGDAQANGYRTWPLRGRARLVSRLIDAGYERHFSFIPGIVQKQRDDGGKYWTLAGSPGLAIPVRDATGRIVALLIRPNDQAAGRKYLYLSSRNYNGPGPGSPIHVPSFVGDKTTVRVTEGALKANIATALSGLLTIGLPGVNATNRVAGLLHHLGTKTARLAFDADARSKPNVAAALKSLAIQLHGQGFAVEMETWDEMDGKGIDDLVAAGKTPRVLASDETSAEIDAIMTAAARPATPATLIQRVRNPRRPGHYRLRFTVEV